MNSEDLMRKALFEDKAGNIWAFNKGADLTNLANFTQVSVFAGINPEFINLLGSSLLHYQVNRTTRKALETLVEVMERNGDDVYTYPVLRLIVALKEAEWVSETGLKALAEKYQNRG